MYVGTYVHITTHNLDLNSQGKKKHTILIAESLGV